MNWSVDFLRDAVLSFARIACGPGSVLVVGSGGRILENFDPQFTPALRSSDPRFTPSGAFAFTLASSPGRDLTVEVSSDLKNWSPVETLTNTVGRVEMLDPLGSANARFYRARQQ